jgi:two-component system invasion response regulator UvrY
VSSCIPTTGASVKVLIADNHPILRYGLKQIIVREFERAICAEAEDAQQVLAQVTDGNWDLVILDITMPGRTGLDVLKDVRRIRPKVPVLVLTQHPEDDYIERVLTAGASGYLSKDAVPEEFLKATRTLLSGRRYVSPALAERLALTLGAEADQPLHEKLSDRELEVLHRIAAGNTVTQIAEELHLSVSTVSTYRARILEKMHMTNTAELIHYAVRRHLVD